MFGGSLNTDLPHAPILTSILLITLVILVSCYGLIVLGRVLRVRAGYGICVFIWFAVVATIYAVVFGDLGPPSDAITYDRQAITLFYGWEGKVSSFRQQDISQGKEGFQYILAFLYQIGGRVPFAGILLNCALVATTFLVVAGTTQIRFGRVNYLFQIGFFLTWPVFLLMGPTLLREPICWLGISLMALGIALLPSKQSVGLAVLICAVALLWWVRMPLGLLALIGLIASAALIVLRSMWGRLGTILYTGLGFISLFFLSPRLLVMSGNDSEQLEVVRGALSSGSESAYHVSSGTLAALLGDIGFIIANLPHILLGPFPWEVSASPVWLWVLTSNVHWLLLLGGVGLVIRKKPIDNVTLCLILTSLVMLVGMSASLTNYGIVVRMRGLPAILILVVLGGQSLSLLPNWLKRRPENRSHTVKPQWKDGDEDISLVPSPFGQRVK